MTPPRVIQPLTPEEQDAFDLVELVIRRDMGKAAPVHVKVVSGYAAILFGDPAMFVAGQTAAEAFEHARALWQRCHG